MTLLSHSRDFASNAPQGADSREWGSCTSLLRQGRCNVRHLVLAPGQRTQTQCHLHRTEHWLVVAGAARVTVDGTTRDLFEGQSMDIPIGAWHSIENQGKVDLHLIEVQTGTYLDDDDLLTPDQDDRHSPLFGQAG